MRSLAVSLVGLALVLKVACEAAGTTNRFPSSIELRDQYEVPQRLEFPRNQVTVLAIADRKGSEEVDGWIALLKDRYPGRLELCGLADVSGVPAFLQGRIRRKFQATRKHPVMMDWTGAVCANLGHQPGVANLLVLDREGMVRLRVTGPAVGETISKVCAVLDATLARSHPASSEANSQLR